MIGLSKPSPFLPGLSWLFLKEFFLSGKQVNQYVDKISFSE
jgi:hypothetical protein